ncbi:NAD(+) diphosphatase [Aestuariibacter sp. AA17]|uniref:NAD(+) diphosphatase n=1 Tax=Fluctibacter corallii TaxID=2984329 RepID=A0ABT3AD78_9ALTE|nr:NAD(+) diphosphatase [Aestuariibacter sp. AA17]MCV2886603.1 NAD(+) diphosphatase [Aestuariibacter sp. AA17]
MIRPVNQLRKEQEAYWIIFSKDKIVSRGDMPALILASWHELPMIHRHSEQLIHVGELNHTPCFAVDMGFEDTNDSALRLHSLRAFLTQGKDRYFELAARAWQQILFLRTHKYCGQCGSRMRVIDWELATHCDTCKHRCYPRISPCIIVAIKKGDHILLAQGPSQRERGMFSTLAGFVESGESLENAVHREVMEEVGIRVKNLRYFGSQPWPFPHSLMVGYLAEYDSGEIQVDGHEILEANWYSKATLPVVPPEFSIAGKLITAALNNE